MYAHTHTPVWPATILASFCAHHAQTATILAQIERRRSNNQKGFFGAFVFKFELGAVGNNQDAVL